MLFYVVLDGKTPLNVSTRGEWIALSAKTELHGLGTVPKMLD